MIYSYFKNMVEGNRLNPPLVSLAGLVGTWVTEAALTKDKLVVLESHTTSHAGAGVCSTVRGAHGNKAVWTVTGETCGPAGGDRDIACNLWQKHRASVI